MIDQSITPDLPATTSAYDLSMSNTQSIQRGVSASHLNAEQLLHYKQQLALMAVKIYAVGFGSMHSVDIPAENSARQTINSTVLFFAAVTSPVEPNS
jgi:hypothetical protein